jgi:predicted acylesterase/phospholipase RssA
MSEGSVLSNDAAFDPEREPLRVLALDGGGMRGHYTACVLEELCRRCSTSNRDGSLFDLGGRFDAIVGVSTGAILASGLALGLAPSELAGFYRTYGRKIFPNEVPDFDQMPLPWRVLSFGRFMMRHFGKPFNSDKPLRQGLESVLGNETFGSAYKRRGIALLIPAVDMSNHKAWVFKTSHIPLKQRDENTPLVEACLASTAAPYFFPVAFYDRPFVDGGLIANSPVLMSLIEAMEMTKSDRSRPIVVVSVGTCPPPVGNHITKESRDWGFNQWQVVRRFSETVLDAQVSMHLYAASFLLPHIDRKATIYRLHQSTPNDDEARKLGLDRASDEALDILERRAATDAQEIKRSIDGDANYEHLRRVFTDVPLKAKAG